YSSSRALSAPEYSIVKPADLSSVFDDISYSKVSTDENKLFFHELSICKVKGSMLDDHNVSLPALVYDIFSTWTNQMGYPCVSINKSGNVLQNHFLMNPTSNVTRISPPNIPFLENDTWVLLNANAVGFYRVHYDDELFSNLLKQLQNNYQVSTYFHLDIVCDAFLAGLMKIEHALSTTIYLVNETKYIPWQTALNNLGYIDLMFSMSMSYGNLPFVFRYMQVSALSTACKYGIAECREIAQKLFKSWMDDSSNKRIHPNLRYTVYCYAIAAGGIEEWEFALNMYKKSSFSMEKAKLLSALACSKEPWILSRLLSYTLEESIIRKQDATKAIISVANNVVGQSLAWSFLKEQWDFIFKQYDFLQKAETQRQERKHLDIAKLKSHDCRRDLVIELRKRFGALATQKEEEDRDVIKKWDTIKEVQKETVQKVIGFGKKKYKE
uniref:ERAP1-like C-terminal domain-containing protein n=1 Tax=Eptatretus burgeri TaxID=7764 RepID=A0A8C4QSG2_EPTBU